MENVRRAKYQTLKVIDSAVKPFVWKPRVLSIGETLEYIVSNRCSAIRFGDGEMAIIRGFSIAFESFSQELSTRLTQALTSNLKNCLVCIPDVFEDLDQYTSKAASFFKVELGRTRRKWSQLLSKDQVYGNSFLSRPYIDRADKTNCKQHFDKAKEMWKESNVWIVEGMQSRLGVGNDLFSNCQSVKRILCPATNAFSRYDKILSKCRNIPKDELVLVALGPCAKVLVYDLARADYQAIDIGHIDIEYEWFLSGSLSKTTITGKYVNEVRSGRSPQNIEDPKYHSEIIDIID